jgi:hypothetical protein
MKLSIILICIALVAYTTAFPQRRRNKPPRGQQFNGNPQFNNPQFGGSGE